MNRRLIILLLIVGWFAAKPMCSTHLEMID